MFGWLRPKKKKEEPYLTVRSDWNPGEAGDGLSRETHRLVGDDAALSTETQRLVEDKPAER
jgi:hypothetical protein